MRSVLSVKAILPTTELPPNVWRLLAVRTLRSFSQGYLNVVAPLYLISLGMSPAGLGLLFTTSFLLGAGLTLATGISADRIGRKPFLIAFTVLMFAWGALYASTTFLPVLLMISAIAGIDRGGGSSGGGQSGPFQPAESAILADLVPPSQRHEVFSLNSFLGAAAAAAGTAVSGLPVWFGGLHLGNLNGDRLLFACTAAIGLASLALFSGLPEPPRRKREKRQGILTKPSAQLVLRQSLASACNAVGSGMVGTMLVVWFNVRFHVGAASIGPMLTISYVLTALSFFAAAAVARRIGSVRLIVMSRLMVAAVVVAMAFAPTFLIAACLNVFRQVFSQMITPVRQSFTMGLFPTEERASVSGLTGVVRRVGAAVSPSLTGAMLSEGTLELPFFISGLLQVASAAMYFWFFSHLDDRPFPAQATESTPLSVGRIEG